MEISNKFSAKKQTYEEDFSREIYLLLAMDRETPVDVFNGKLVDVKCERIPYVIVTADIHVDITCSVGYDRVEEYWDKERQSDGGYKSVKKTRYITDWTPYSMSNEGEYMVCVPNGPHDDDLDVVLEESLAIRKRASSFVPLSYRDSEYDNLELNAHSIDTAINACGYSCCLDAPIPGDRKKDVSYTTKYEIKNIDCAVIPKHRAKFEYKEGSYEAQGYACGDIDASMPARPNDTADVKKAAGKQAKPFLYVIPVGIVVWLVGFILNFVGYPQFMTPAIGIAILIIGISLSAYFIRKKQNINKMTAERQIIKSKALNELLLKRGLRPLDESETAAILVEEKS